jgi:hypothetical protein
MYDRRFNYAALSRELELEFTTAYAGELAGLEDLGADGRGRLVAGGLEVTPLWPAPAPRDRDAL